MLTSAHSVQRDEQQVGSTNDPSSLRYHYDGDQGQPSFLFERSGASLFFSVIEQRDFGFGGHPDSPRYPDWHWVEADLHEFLAAVDGLVSAFRRQLERAVPDLAHHWFGVHL